MDVNEIIETYKTVILKRYALFDGRAGLKEFWYFVLVNFVISILLSAVGLQSLGSLYGLLVLVPSIAVGIRRMHDTNRSGWWLLINFIPLAGWIIFIIFAAQKGTPGSNTYGTAAAKSY